MEGWEGWDYLGRAANLSAVLFCVRVGPCLRFCHRFSLSIALDEIPSISPLILPHALSKQPQPHHPFIHPNHHTSPLHTMLAVIY